MDTLVITYDLLRQGQDYNTLITELRRLGGKRPLMSVWTLQSSSSASAIRDHLQNFVDANDRVFVGTTSSWAWTNVLEEPHRN